MGWKVTPRHQPPKDGSWFVTLYDDGSGTAIWAWHDDVNGNEGWHETEGVYDGDTDFPPGTVWIECPNTFVAWIEGRSTPAELGGDMS